VAQDHNDIYSIVERLRILEEGLTPVNVKHGLNAQQKSVDQLSATFKPKTVAVLTAKKDPKNPLAGKLVGDSVEDEREPVEEAVATEDVLDKVKKSFNDYLKSVADEVKQDSDIKEKSKVDHDLGKKDTRDRDLIAKDKKDLDEDHQKLEVGDCVMVTGPNHYEGEFAEVTEFSPSGKFVVVKFDNGDEASMHLSDVEYHDDQEDVEDDWYDEELKEDPTTDDETIEPPPAPVENPVMPESVAVKTVTNECGLWEIHGNEPSGFEIRHGNNAMRSRFKSIDEAEMALEMFAARRRKADESQDYIEEA
jgi:hypothetical protein